MRHQVRNNHSGRINFIYSRAKRDCFRGNFYCARAKRELSTVFNFSFLI